MEIHKQTGMKRHQQTGMKRHQQPGMKKLCVRDIDAPASLFLRKAYHLVSNCPPSLGGWTENGNSFHVRDIKLFSEHAIPTVYRHNNFSSFVRQLNFYGFEKIKSDLSTADNPCWEFRHTKFIRGKPHLLSGVKRAVRQGQLPEAPASHENVILKSCVNDLSEKILAVDQSLTSLTNLLETFVKSSGHPMTAEAKHFLEGIEVMCRKKCRKGRMGEVVDLDHEAREPAKGDDEDLCMTYYCNINMGEYSDDADSVSDAASQRSEGTETHDHSEADFDNLLDYIAHGRVTPEGDSTLPAANPSPLALPSSQAISNSGPDLEYL